MVDGVADGCCGGAEGVDGNNSQDGVAAVDARASKEACALPYLTEFASDLDLTAAADWLRATWRDECVVRAALELADSRSDNIVVHVMRETGRSRDAGNHTAVSRQNK
jgi:hypothetical protein